MSLDTVAARLDNGAQSSSVNLEERQSPPCWCLQKYTDVLCKLQTIKQRQSPIQIDTLLTCANLVLDIAERQLKCQQCLHDFCVMMQLVMVMQTIQGWFEAQCQLPDTSTPDLPMKIGQHDLTADERDLVKATLITRALRKAYAMANVILAKTEDIATHRSGMHLWKAQGEEFRNLTKVVTSLAQSLDVLIKSLVHQCYRNQQDD